VTYAGAELGGTKCVLLLAEDDKKVLERQVVPTTSPDETLGRVQEILVGWQRSHGVQSIGIASFGPLDLDQASPTYGHIRAMQKPGWDHVDLLGSLANLSAPIALDTDVNGAAIAEMCWGAGRGMDDFAYITVGTGVGVGLIVAGQPVRGFGHCEMGHIRVARFRDDDWPGSCPFHGDCVEGLASGAALKARFGDRLLALKPHDPAWDGVVWTLAQLCQAIACTTAPRRIVIGGGVAAAQPHLLPRIEQALRSSLNNYLSLPGDEPYVRAPGLGSDAGPLGAIALAMKASS
jgi:fructokinase